MKVCVVTGARAEYGLLKPLLKLLKEDSFFDLRIIATCMHLSPEFGLTIQEIEHDGFFVDEKVECLLSSDTTIGINKSMGLTIISMAEAYQRLHPDLLILLGDRFEIFAAASAAHVSLIPIAHIHGGELTEVAIDDAFRHSLTKMAVLHFTTTEVYRKRVIQLGENPDRVFNVGALGVDNIKKVKLLTKKEIEFSTGIKFLKKNLLITYHPVTLEYKDDIKDLKNMFDVLKSQENTSLIFTKANADAGGREINKIIDDFVITNSNCYAFTSLGQLKYLSVMKYVTAVIGNSSSGIIEAPSFRIGTINIGDRQKGRVRAASVIDCNLEKKSIKNAFRKLYSSDFQKIIKHISNPYGNGNAATQIINILKDNNEKLKINKTFFDL